jgi:hypothetical protein
MKLEMNEKGSGSTEGAHLIEEEIIINEKNLGGKRWKKTEAM